MNLESQPITAEGPLRVPKPTWFSRCGQCRALHARVRVRASHATTVDGHVEPTCKVENRSPIKGFVLVPRPAWRMVCCGRRATLHAPARRTLHPLSDICEPHVTLEFQSITAKGSLGSPSQHGDLSHYGHYRTLHARARPRRTTRGNHDSLEMQRGRRKGFIAVPRSTCQIFYCGQCRTLTRTRART